jgi:hypothetical protein
MTPHGPSQQGAAAASTAKATCRQDITRAPSIRRPPAAFPLSPKQNTPRCRQDPPTRRCTGRQYYTSYCLLQLKYKPRGAPHPRDSLLQGHTHQLPQLQCLGRTHGYSCVLRGCHRQQGVSSTTPPLCPPPTPSGCSPAAPCSGVQQPSPGDTPHPAAAAAPPPPPDAREKGSGDMGCAAAAVHACSSRLRPRRIQGGLLLRGSPAAASPPPSAAAAAAPGAPAAAAAPPAGICQGLLQGGRV